jgi:hypothetical protein
MITALGLFLAIDTVGGGIRKSLGVSARVGDKAKSCSISEGALELGHGPSFRLSAYHVHKLLLTTNPDSQIEMSNALLFYPLSKPAVFIYLKLRLNVDLECMSATLTHPSVSQSAVSRGCLHRVLIVEKLLPESPVVVGLTKLINLLDLSRRQLESCGSQVVAHSLFLGARRDRHDVLVDAPPQVDLILADRILLYEFAHVVVDWSWLRLVGRA